MIEMLDAVLLLKLLSASTTTAPETLRSRLRDAILAIAITMEAVFAQIEKAAPTPASVVQAITNDRERNAEQLVRAASAIGFALDASGHLPQSFTHAKAQRIRRAARGQGETLSARVSAQVLAASQQPEHPLRELAKRAPSLLLDIGRLVDARGHGDEVPRWVTAAVAEDIKETVANTVRTVIEVID